MCVWGGVSHIQSFQRGKDIRRIQFVSAAMARSRERLRLKTGRNRESVSLLPCFYFVEVSSVRVRARTHLCCLSPVSHHFPKLGQSSPSSSFILSPSSVPRPPASSSSPLPLPLPLPAPSPHRPPSSSQVLPGLLVLPPRPRVGCCVGVLDYVMSVLSVSVVAWRMRRWTGVFMRDTRGWRSSASGLS